MIKDAWIKLKKEWALQFHDCRDNYITLSEKIGTMDEGNTLYKHRYKKVRCSVCGEEDELISWVETINKNITFETVK